MTEAFDNWLARELMGEELWATLQKQFDEARNYLKNCGKPKDQYDRALIEINKSIATSCKREMYPHEQLKALRIKERIT